MVYAISSSGMEKTFVLLFTILLLTLDNPAHLTSVYPWISLTILLTLCHAILLMLVWRIWYLIN